MNQEIKLLDVVALLKVMPDQNLKVGQVGTVVEVYSDDDFEVEFVDKKGRTLAMLPLKREDLLVLRYEMEVA
ncbi:MAG: DUF4926 domain-containing protein [Saprospiraceae bacterium]|nr:DUF4926 domain-containing protein [Saprospiraceae bacterium]